MLSSWYNVTAIGFYVAGMIFILLFSQKSPGTLTPEAIKSSRHVWWIETGIFLIALGVTMQLIGYFFG